MLKKIIILIITVCIALTSCSNQTNSKKNIILFDASVTPIESVVSFYMGGKFEKKDSCLLVKINRDEGTQGILIKGNWDLSECTRLSLKIVNEESQGDLQLEIRLGNPDADPAKREGVFIDRIIVPEGDSKTILVDLPPMLPYAREINKKLSGMRQGPFPKKGIVSDIDLKNVADVALYVNSPKQDYRWSIKYIIAEKGITQKVDDWMLLPPDKFFPFIDIYGQFKYKDWPGKTKSDGDLKKALEDEIADNKANPGPKDWDKYGGWEKGTKMNATGYFRLEKVNGKWWMIDPEGHLFWSHGPVRVSQSSGMTPLDGREFYFTNLPEEGSPFAKFYTTHDELLYPYYLARNIKKTYDFSSANISRKYGSDWNEKYLAMAHERLRSWGMNTIGNGSDNKLCRMQKTPYTDRFEIKSPAIEASSGYWWKFKDPFHPEFRTSFRQQLLSRKEELDDPWCIGFFVDNEIGWGSKTQLAEWSLQSPDTQPAKLEMIKWLNKKYGYISKLNRVWKSNYTDWEALLHSQEKPPAGSNEDCSEFTAVITEEYFKVIRDEFKKAAPHKLYLGCRFAGSNDAALRLGAKYCDVLSFNIYRHTLDNFKLPEGIDKPVMIGEFHFGALDRGLFHPSLVKVSNQEERGKAYAEYVTSALRHPNVIGTHWHQFGDQATTGRFDGENFQNGLVDVCDRPYPETIAKIREVGYNMYEIRNRK
jgi:hypothetical protein